MSRENEITRVEAALDAFHAAAAAAEEERHLALLAPDAAFLGTGSERWAGEDYRAFVHSNFRAAGV
jgi:SnoaL-like domain